MSAKPDLLARGKQKAVAQPVTKPKKDEMRHVVVPEALRPKFIELCELGFIAKGLEGTTKSRKDEMGWEFTKMWAHEMWETRQKPDNFRAVVPRNGGPVMDCMCNFVLEFRKDSIKGKVPTADQIPEGKTFEEVVMATLRGFGISEAQAKKFVQEEIVVTDTLMQRPYDELYACEEGTPEKSAATKMLTYMQCRSKAALAKLSLFTDEEEAACLVTKQTITLKDGLADRIFTYCESEEQLLALLKWINVTQKIYQFIVGEADENSVNEKRLGKTTVRFLYGEVA